MVLPKKQRASAGREKSNSNFGKPYFSVTFDLPGSDTSLLPSGGSILPFLPSWSFGRSRPVGILNISTKKNPVIFFASAHLGVIYNYETNSMQFIQGHQNSITSASVDTSCKWLVTADAEKNHSLVVWDTETLLPIHTVFSPEGDDGIRDVCISPDAKYIVTVSAGEHQMVSFRCWTFGKDEPDDRVELPDTLGRIRRIVISQDTPEYILMTSDCHAIFVTWDGSKLNFFVPEGKRTVGRFTESIYLEGTHQAATASVSGHVMIWSDVKYADSYVKSEQVSNNKFLVKIIKLENDPIIALKTVKNIVGIANSKGQLHFYDQRFHLLYWYTNKEAGPLKALYLSMNHKHCLVRGEVNNLAQDEEGNEEYEDRTSENEKILKTLPSDASLLRKPFPLIQFFAVNNHREVYLINLSEKSCRKILEENKGKLTAIDIHKELPYLYIGSDEGSLFLYNYLSKEMIHHKDLFTGDDVAITCLKFAPFGRFLICGTSNGSLWTIDPLTLDFQIEEPYDNGTSATTHIILSDDEKFVAVADVARCVQVYEIPDNNGTSDWKFYGRQCAHYKPIRTIMFMEVIKPQKTLRLFSLGEDRLLVEYDFIHNDSLKITNSCRIEQIAIPTAMTEYSNSEVENCILVANNEFKFKLYNGATSVCKKTLLCPQLDYPVTYLQLFQGKKEEVVAEYILFVAQTFLGIAIVPLDGNPHKSLAVTGHPKQVTHICMSNNNEFVFTTGKDDDCVLMWEVNTPAVEVMAYLGGDGLEPYFCLIEGGKDGWLFQEMQDFFYFIQIRAQGQKSQKEFRPGKSIPICDLHDIVVALGFYPSFQEMENMINEVRYANYAETGKLQTSIEFNDFVVLFLNHRPTVGTSIQDLKKAFKTFSSDEKFLSRSDIVNILTATGECFSNEQVQKYFRILLPREELITSGRLHVRSDDTDIHSEEKQIIPEQITFLEFVRDILGICPTQFPDSDTDGMLEE